MQEKVVDGSAVIYYKKTGRIQAAYTKTILFSTEAIVSKEKDYDVKEVKTIQVLWQEAYYGVSSRTFIVQRSNVRLILERRIRQVEQPLGLVTEMPIKVSRQERRNILPILRIHIVFILSRQIFIIFIYFKDNEKNGHR